MFDLKSHDLKMCKGLWQPITTATSSFLNPVLTLQIKTLSYHAIFTFLIIQYNNEFTSAVQFFFEVQNLINLISIIIWEIHRTMDI